MGGYVPVCADVRMEFYELMRACMAGEAQADM